MREALRLAPPAPLRAAGPLEDTTLLGKYPVKKDATVIWCNIYDIQRDTKVWGPDVSAYSVQRSRAHSSLQALEFRPERMLDGKFEAMPVCVHPRKVIDFTDSLVAGVMAAFRQWHACLHCQDCHFSP